MRKPTFTDEDIISAGKRLKAENKPVTANAIKLLLGGGNPTRIRTVWDRYVVDSESPEPESSKLNDGELDTEGTLMLLLRHSVDQAASKTETVFELLLSELKTSIGREFEQEVTRQTNSLAFENGELKADLKYSKRRITQLEELREDEQKQLREMAREKEKLEETVERLTNQLKELQEERAKLPRH